MNDSLLTRAFEVEELTDDFDPSRVPTTGQEFLQHVMFEASKCPQVVVANIDRKKIKNHVSIKWGCDPLIVDHNLTPSLEWQQVQIAMFSDLRKRVEACRKSEKFQPIPLPKASDEDKWHNLCFGGQNARTEPLLTVLLSMSEAQVRRLIEYQVEWLEDKLKPNQGKWIYSLLACLDLPLMPETCSCLRDLVRQCAKIRSKNISIEDGDVVELNLIICLVTKYFGQVDLGD